MKDHIARLIALCAATAILVPMQGCQKSASGPPKIDAERQTAAAGGAKDADKKTDPTSLSTSETPGAKKAGEKKAAEPAGDPAFASRPAALPKADIDTNQGKYFDGVPVEIAADGKPTTVLYYPPRMTSVIFTQGGKQKVRLLLGTVTVSGDSGNKLEVHISAFPLNSSSGQMTKIAVIYSDKAEKGQSWSATALGMSIKLEALDFGESDDPVFPGTGMSWMKLRITAR